MIVIVALQINTEYTQRCLLSLQLLLYKFMETYTYICIYAYEIN